MGFDNFALEKLLAVPGVAFLNVPFAKVDCICGCKQVALSNVPHLGHVSLPHSMKFKEANILDNKETQEKVI